MMSVRRYEEYRICIADTGRNIEPELAEHIFEPFSRGDKARSTRGGSGLGLSIARKIVEMHGGKIWLTFSASGTGSCYCVGLLSADENADLLSYIPKEWIYQSIYH